MKNSSLPTFSVEPSSRFIGILLGRRIADHNALFSDAPFGEGLEDIYENLVLRQGGDAQQVAMTLPYATAYLKTFNYIAEKVLELTAHARENGLDEATANGLNFYMSLLGSMADGE